MSTQSAFSYEEEMVSDAPNINEIDASEHHQGSGLDLDDMPLGQMVREEVPNITGKKRKIGDDDGPPEEEIQRVKKLRQELKELYAANPHLTAPQSHRFLVDVDKLSAHECELALLHARAQIGRDTAARITQVGLRALLTPIPLSADVKNSMLTNMMNDAYFLNAMNFYVIDSMSWLPAWAKVALLGAGHLVEGLFTRGAPSKLWNGGAATTSPDAPTAENLLPSTTSSDKT